MKRNAGTLGIILGFLLLLLSPVSAIENLIITNFVLNSGTPQNNWISSAIELDISDNLQLLNNFQSVSFAKKEQAIKSLPASQRQDPLLIGKKLRASLVITAELIEEKNSIICLGKIYYLGDGHRVKSFSVNGRTKWLIDFSENITWQIIDQLNLRKFSKEDEDRLRYKIKNNERLKAFLHAEESLIAKDYPKAIKQYQNLMEREPNFISPYLRVAEIFFAELSDESTLPHQHEYFVKLLPLLQEALRIDHRNSTIYLLLGKLYHQDNWVGRDYEQAIEYLKQATELFPYYTEAYRELAYLYAEKLKKYAKAIEVCDQIAAYDPQNPIVRKDIENIYRLSQGIKFIKR